MIRNGQFFWDWKASHSQMFARPIHVVTFQLLSHTGDGVFAAAKKFRKREQGSLKTTYL